MKAKTLDLLGISAAGLCLIHCLVFPVILIVPMGITHNAYIDLFFFVFGTGLVYRIVRRLEQVWLKLLFWAAILMIGISVLFDLFYHIHLPLIYIGAVLLITAHMINFKSHKHASAKKCDPERNKHPDTSI